MPTVVARSNNRFANRMRSLYKLLAVAAIFLLNLIIRTTKFHSIYLPEKKARTSCRASM